MHYAGYRRDIDVPTTGIIYNSNNTNFNLNNYFSQGLKASLQYLLGLNNSVLARILAIGY